jgi:hypothetical protein
MPQGYEEKKNRLSDMVGELLNRIEQGSTTNVIWINQWRKNASENNELAHGKRRCFARKKEQGRTLKECLWQIAIAFSQKSEPTF